VISIYPSRNQSDTGRVRQRLRVGSKWDGAASHRRKVPDTVLDTPTRNQNSPSRKDDCFAGDFGESVVAAGFDNFGTGGR